MKPGTTSRPIVIAALAAALAPLVWHLLALPGGAEATLGLAGRHGGHAVESQLAWAWIALAGGWAFFTCSAPSAARPGRARAGRRRSLGAALAVAAAGAAAVAIGWPPFVALAACALGLAALRIATGRTAPSPRGALLEGAVLFGSLSLAHWLARAFGPGPLGFAASVWGFFLVQSLCLASSVAARSPRRGGDAFEAARRRLESLLADDRL